VSGHPLDRATAVLGVAGVVAVVFWPLSGDPWEFTKVGPAAAVITLVLGGVAVAGGRLGRPQLTLVAGAGYLAAALLQLAQAGRDANWVGGDGSTFSYFLGLGVGLLAVATARRTELDRSDIRQ
jgi:hypothetical protein